MRKADNLPPYCAVVTKSWSLDFSEPSGPVQACYGTALPLLQGAGARGGVVVKALRYKPAGRGFDSRWCHWNSSMT